MEISPRLSLLNPEIQRPRAWNSQPRDSRLLWLDKNENFDSTFSLVHKEILQNISIKSLSSYPDLGLLYKKIASWANVDPDSIYITAGSDGGIRSVFESFVNVGDVILHSSPTFAMYPVYAKIFGAQVKTIEYQASITGPFIDIDYLFKLIRDLKPKLVCMPNPDSPTGTILSEDIILSLMRLCEESKTILLIDEAYHPFYSWTAVPLVKRFKNLVICRTFSKAWGLAGLRIGYNIASPEVTSYFHKIKPMYEVGSFAAEFVVNMLDHSDEMLKSVTRLNDSKHRFQQRMRDLGFICPDTYGNFAHVNFGVYENSVHRALSNKVLYRKSFDHSSVSPYTRFSISTEDEMMYLSALIKKSYLDCEDI